MPSHELPAESLTAPLVSVVIATYRRAGLLARCLRALSAQRCDGASYEVIVADDGCENGIAALVRSLAGIRPDWTLRYVPVAATQGPAGARNAGWRAARGDIIAFTDDDTIPAPDWLREGCAAFVVGEPPCVAVAGRIVVPLPPRPTDHQRDTGGLAAAEFVTANCFVRRDALERIGGFDERFTRAWREDSDLQFRLLELGAIRHAPNAVVEHPVRPTHWGSSAAAQAKVYFDALLYKKHPRLYRTHIRPVPPWHYYVTVLALLVLLVGVIGRSPALTWGGGVVWLLFTAAFCARRLRGAALTPVHIAEMIATSVVIPPLSLYWRMRGAIAFRVIFL